MKKPIAIWTRYDDNSIDYCYVYHSAWRSKLVKLFVRQSGRFYSWLWQRMWKRK